MPLFLRFLGSSFIGLGLIKLGALSVMVNVLTAVITTLLIVNIGLVGLLALRYFRKP